MKDVMDAFYIRNQVLGCLEDADATTEPRRRQSLLTFVAIGGASPASRRSARFRN
jgi:hypothetical protein